MAKQQKKGGTLPTAALPKTNGVPFEQYGTAPTQPGEYAVPAEPEDADAPVHQWPRQELPVISRTYVDRVAQVESILQTLEQGIYRDASFLCDQILRDERISAVIDTRIMGLLGLPVHFRPANSSPKAREIAESLEGDEDHPGLFHQMLPVSELAQLSRWSLLLGAGLAEVRWETKGDWLPKIKVWHPNVLWWRWDLTHLDSGSYFVQTADEGQIEIRPNDGQWLLHTPKGYRRSWLDAMLRSLAKPYLGRAWTATADWPRYNEVHGLPTRKVIVPSSATEAEKRRFYNQVRNLGVESVIQIPARKSGGVDKDEEKWDLELLEAKSDTYKSFAEWLDRVEANISIRVLGHNLSSEVKSGALASAKVSELVRDDLKRWDALTLSQSIREQVLRHYCQYNYGDPEMAPYPEWEVDPTEDRKAKGTFYKDLGSALFQMSQAKVPVDVRALLESENIPTTEEELEPSTPATDAGAAPTLTLTPSDVGLIVSVNEGRAAQGLGPLMRGGSPDPEGDLSIAEYKARHAQVVNAAAQAEEGTLNDPVPSAKEEAPSTGADATGAGASEGDGEDQGEGSDAPTD